VKPTKAPSSSRRRKVSVERPFFPTPSQRTVCPSEVSWRSSANARRITCALNAPARPRSPVSGTRSVAEVVSRCWRSGSPRTEPAARPTPAISSRIVSAYGRIASMRLCARRSLAAATSSIARVIFRVLRTERIRRL
jgi:hypothetical protein